MSQSTVANANVPIKQCISKRSATSEIGEQQPVKRRKTSRDQKSTTPAKRAIIKKRQTTRSNRLTASKLNDEGEKFFKMVPHKTKNPSKIMQQESALELLRLNGALNQNTFDICIAKPDPVANGQMFRKMFNAENDVHDLDDIDVSHIVVPMPSPFNPRYYRPNYGKENPQMLAAEAAVLQNDSLKFPRSFCERKTTDKPEWGTDGRIIYITERCLPFKKQRAKELVHMVDEQLGIAKRSLADGATVYLAMVRHHVIGVCVVQPLKQARRLISRKTFSDETFNVRCGISRIWTVPEYRRLGVASSMVQAVREYIIRGSKLSMDDVAFMKPNKSARKLSVNLSNRADILVFNA